MKFLDGVLYTAWIVLLCLLVGMGIIDKALIEAPVAIAVPWVLAYFCSGALSMIAPETVSKLKPQQVDQFRFNKRLVAKLLNITSLYVWMFASATFPINEWHAIIFTLIAGAFSGYIYSQNIYHLIRTNRFFAWADARTDRIEFYGTDPKQWRNLLDDHWNVRSTLRKTHDQLGFFSKHRLLGLTIKLHPRRERSVITPEKIYVKVLLARYGRWRLPEGLSLNKLVSEDTRHALSVALQREVVIHCSPESGVWIAITHPGCEGVPESYRPYLDQSPSDVEAQAIDRRLQDTLSERDASDLVMLEKARATLTVPARLVDGD